VITLQGEADEKTREHASELMSTVRFRHVSSEYKKFDVQSAAANGRGKNAKQWLYTMNTTGFHGGLE